MGRTLLAAIALLTLLGSAATASALQRPGRMLLRPAPVTALGLTHGSIAYAVGRTKQDCDHVELWNTDTRGTWRFGRKRPCGDLPLFSGIGPIGVATNRVVWVSFAGGNLTDWQLWTATSTKRTPKRLRFVERDTSEPSPIVVGPGTAQGVPYAVETEITWLAESGAPIFRAHASSEVRSITAGDGPLGWRVAASLANGEVIVLNDAGALDATFTFAPGQVKWIGLAPTGLLVQLPGAKVEIRSGAPTRTVQLKANAIVLDYAGGRLLYRVAQSFWLRDVRSGTDTRLLQGSSKQPIAASLDTHGLAWRQGSSVNWACAICLEG
jgi:hypothetical protein